MNEIIINFLFKDTLKGAILHHPICPQQESIELQQLLEDASASVGVQWVNTGHQLTMEEVEGAKQWYDQIYS